MVKLKRSDYLPHHRVLQPAPIVDHPDSSDRAGPSTRRKRAEGGDHDIDTNQCCVCFRTYKNDETGLEWVECVCQRWLHKECIDYEIACNANGEDLLCPLCCV